MVKIVAISGSRREGSYTRLALEHALRAAEEKNAETELIDLGDADLPLYHPDIDEQGDSVELLRTVREADGVLIGSPVYHGSYSSTFKNFHDYCGFDEYESTVVGLLVVAGGGPYASTLDHLRSTVRGLHGWVVPHQVGIRTARQQFAEGEFTNPDIATRTAKLGYVVTETVLRRKTNTQIAPCE